MYDQMMAGRWIYIGTPGSIDLRLRTGYLDQQAGDLDDAIARVELHARRREAVSIVLLGNATELPRRAGWRHHTVPGHHQTSAHFFMIWASAGFPCTDTQP